MEDPYGRAEFDPWGDAFSDSDDEVEDGDQPADVPAPAASWPASPWGGLFVVQMKSSDPLDNGRL